MGAGKYYMRNAAREDDWHREDDSRRPETSEKCDVLLTGYHRELEMRDERVLVVSANITYSLDQDFIKQFA